ncbi:hypothetical protein CPC08DRAFT_711585 [Agrocybe pediades]|nr:hypothetical protein CPC08DRAFT_711585 [Agrocybe pediades]
MASSSLQPTPHTLPPDSVSSFRRDSLSIVAVEVLFFGFYTCLFVITMYAVCVSERLFQGLNRQSNPSVRMARTQEQTTKLALTCLLVISFLLSALHVALSWWYSAWMLQNDGASPLLVADFLADQPVFFLVIEALTLAFNTTITDSVSVWKCWKLYDRKLTLILFPLLCIATSIIMAVVALVDRVKFTFALMHATVEPAEGIARWQHFLIAYFVPSLASTVYTTGMIICRIKTRFSDDDIRPSFPFARVTSMVVESALLYTISHVVTVGLLVKVSPDFNFSQNILVSNGRHLSNSPSTACVHR